MRNLHYYKITVVVALLSMLCVTTNAQIKYDTNSRLTIGNVTPHSDTYKYYDMTVKGSVFVTGSTSGHFFQIDTGPAATRLASHYDQVVFYNTETSTFNSIQVKNVYNYSDARAKNNIQAINNGLNYITRLNPVSYNFDDNSNNTKFRNGGNGKEIGLLAQEVEEVLPNVVLTDPDGNKLINYTAIIPVMIDAIKSLKQEIEELKTANK